MPEEFLDESAAPALEAQPVQEELEASAGLPATGAEGITGEGSGMVEQNPLTAADEPVGPEEQAEYDDAFNRVMAMIHDTRENNGKKSIADGVIKQISNSEMKSTDAIGKAAGNVMRLFHENAKRQGKEYSGDVLREVGMDLITELIDVAQEIGAVKGIPEDDTPEYEEFNKLAVLEAMKLFGDYYLQTGQADVQGEQEGMMDQMNREATSGELDDWDMKEMNPDAMQEAMAQKQGIA